MNQIVTINRTTSKEHNGSMNRLPFPLGTSSETMKKHYIIFTFLFFSGAVSIAYQIVWMRLLALSVGSTSLSLGIIVGSFFFGLGIGSLLSKHIHFRPNNRLALYALLELTIGISSILLLPVLLHLDQLITAFPIVLDQPFLKFILIFLLLLLPTSAMGATLPVIASFVINEKKTMGQHYAYIYSLNTFGAVLGALSTGFILIPLIGLDGTIYIAAGANTTLAVLAYYFSRKNKGFPPIPKNETPPKQSIHRPRLKILFILFITGFVSIATEIGWTKFLIIFTGSTIYGFSIILAILLFGIAMGSWAIRTYIDQFKNAEIWLSYTLVLSGIFLIVSYIGLSYIPLGYTFLIQSEYSEIIQNTIKYLLIFLVIFPPSFLFGTIFPLLLTLYTQQPNSVQTDSANAFGVNTIAGILGSIVAGFWLIPYFGTGILLLSMAIMMIIASGIFLLNQPIQKNTIGLSVIVIGTLCMTGYLPLLDYKPLITASYNDNQHTTLKDPNYIFLKEGKSGVISLMQEQNRYIRLLNNGLSEASLDIKDDDNVNLAEALLGFIPVFLHKNPTNAFVVGYGGGTTVYALTKTALASIKVVELEPAIIEALRSVYQNKGIPPLRDRRVVLEFNDARALLLAQKQKYDIIVSQPSHPWLSGASSLFTREFFEISKSKLKTSGIYGQWVNLFHMDTSTLKAIIKAFNEVYPYSISFIITQSEDLLLFGSQTPFNPKTDQIKHYLNDPNIQLILSPYNLKRPQDLFAYIALSREEMQAMTKNTLPSTDMNLICETRLSKFHRKELPTEENPYILLQKFNIP